jgi:arabinogalactan endo-1,4-beta-galactosidase
MTKYFFQFNIYFFIFCLFLFSCKQKEIIVTPVSNSIAIKGADASYLPSIRQSGIRLYNRSNVQEDMLVTLKNSGVNTIRLRLWKQPSEQGSDFNSVKLLANECHQKGMKVLLSVQYSDTWADPSQQAKPSQWEGNSISQMNDSISVYTTKIMNEIHPDFIQIGNEINNGFLWPEGALSNIETMKLFINTAIQSVRQNNTSTKIILHFAGFENAINFYSNFSDVDYDIIGVSYYPIWHGKDLTVLKNNLYTISNTFNKNTLIVETSYPFTLGWNDWTNNIIGLNSQILPEFPASPDGQKNYLNKIKDIVITTPNCLGFCYWGGEWISYRGDTASNGSSWENQAFWDFNKKALPILDNY